MEVLLAEASDARLVAGSVNTQNRLSWCRATTMPHVVKLNLDTRNPFDIDQLLIGPSPKMCTLICVSSTLRSGVSHEAPR